jgi:hypothetical protein
LQKMKFVIFGNGAKRSVKNVVLTIVHKENVRQRIKCLRDIVLGTWSYHH